jgi:hypothetical protein
VLDAYTGLNQAKGLRLRLGNRALFALVACLTGSGTRKP